MTTNEKALEIAKNLHNTISKLTGSRYIGESSLKNGSIFSGTRPSKSNLQNQLKRICKKYNIDIEKLK